MNLNKERLASGTKDVRAKKWKKQRIERGYSDRDVWSFDSFLAQVISGGVRQIGGYAGYEGEEGEWRKTFNFIADQFEWYANEQFSFTDEFVDKINDPESDYRKAWVLLEENFGGLWT